MRTKHITAIFALAMLPFMASAQRTAYGERQVSLSVHYSPSPSYGASASFGQYLLSSYWEGGLTADNCIKQHTGGTYFGNLRVEAYGAFLYRIFGTRSRQFSVYGGGDAFLGFEFLDPFRQLDDPTWQSMLLDGYRQHKFIYGAAPRVDAEFFVLPPLAITLRIRIPVTLNGQFRSDLVGFQGGVGLRFNF